VAGVDGGDAGEEYPVAGKDGGATGMDDEGEPGRIEGGTAGIDEEGELNRRDSGGAGTDDSPGRNDCGWRPFSS